MRRFSRFCSSPLLKMAVVVFAAALALATHPGVEGADEDWTIKELSASYVVGTDATVDVTEAISVDFGNLQKHGIFRDIPIRYKYDDKHDRVVDVKVVAVSDGEKPLPYTTATSGANLQIKIGDPGRTVTGAQRYLISYQIKGALNPFPDHDELYLNVTGNEWTVPIEKANGSLQAPALTSFACFEGPTGSTRPCQATPRGAAFNFNATTPLPAGSGLTFVAALPKGAVAVSAPSLVRLKSPAETVRDFLGLYPPQIVAAAVALLVIVAAIGRLWWTRGRDRWYGDVQYLTGATRESTRPLFAHETVVPEFTPPELSETKRKLRPAEVGVLIDEKADTLDVSATIVDLAVRGYLRITDLGNSGLLGMGGHDYELAKLKDADTSLLDYERTLHLALFETGTAVKLSELKNKFADDLKQVKNDLYDATARKDGLFPQSPESARLIFRVGGLVLAAAGAGLTYVLGLGGAALIGIPVIVGGLVLAAFAGAMPRRTSKGRELFRRSLGFREYMVTAETEKQKFDEEANIFDSYLPYAIVFHCTAQWAKRFQGLEGQTRTGAAGAWYVSPNPFIPLAFASDIDSFSSHISSVIASTPAGSGGSGFGGGGFSGGGMGGGGGGSW